MFLEIEVKLRAYNVRSTKHSLVRWTFVEIEGF